MEKARHLVVKIIDYLSPFAPKSRHHCTRRQRNNNIDWGIIEFGPNVILFMITWTHLSVQVYIHTILHVLKLHVRIFGLCHHDIKESFFPWT